MHAAPASASAAHGESLLWDGGWYRFAHRAASPNHNQRPAGTTVDLVVLHSISLPPGAYGGPEVHQLFTNTLDWDAHPYFGTIRGLQVSSHFFIRRNGELWQFVNCDDRAWHAGQSHYRGRDGVNDNAVGIELEGLEGLTFEPPQYETLASICTALAQRYPQARHIAGHEHVAPGRKQDPGAGFDWPALMQSLGWEPPYFPEAVRPATPAGKQP